MKYIFLTLALISTFGDAIEPIFRLQSSRMDLNKTNLTLPFIGIKG